MTSLSLDCPGDRFLFLNSRISNKKKKFQQENLHQMLVYVFLNVVYVLQITFAGFQAA